MAEKMTKKMWYEAINEVLAASGYEHKVEAMDFITHEIELLERKSASNKLTKRQQENIGVTALIRDALFEAAKPVTITELLAESPSLAPYTPQRVSALLSQMKKSGEVVRTEVKKKAYFSLAETE